MERRHYLTFTLSGSHIPNLEKCLLGGVSWCANPSRLPLRVTHLRDFTLPLAGGAYSETEQTCREELTRSGRTLDLHTSCLLTKATSGYTDLIWRNASGVFTAPFRGLLPPPVTRLQAPPVAALADNISAPELDVRLRSRIQRLLGILRFPSCLCSCWRGSGGSGGGGPSA